MQKYKNFKLSLIIPCYNEAQTINECVERVMKITENQSFSLEIIIVDDCSTDESLKIIENISQKFSDIVKVLRHKKNRGKGAALRTGLIYATGDFVGIQDADNEYNPQDYLTLLEPLLAGKADVVYGSRYLRSDTRRVLYYWHTWMNKTLTTISNMFSNLDITDMETCYKLFRREVIQKIAPSLKEERFGFEPEITVKVAQGGYRVYECAISYNPRSYEEGKKIGWKDGLRALYCLLHYGANTAPLPMQLLLYFFIGVMSMLVNLFCFSTMTYCGISLNISIGAAFLLAAMVNYILCIFILFRHNSRWKTLSEVFWYLITIILMGALDYGVTNGLIMLSMGQIWAKIWSSVVGFFGNFALRKWLIFPEKEKH
jgi:glycosyltransferase involved in cell wall biosynthesis